VVVVVAAAAAPPFGSGPYSLSWLLLLCVCV
jgi:hypothetical protein